MRQHLENPDKQHLRSVRVIIDDTFNKSVCLDLESYLIRLLAGDGIVPRAQPERRHHRSRLLRARRVPRELPRDLRAAAGRRRLHPHRSRRSRTATSSSSRRSRRSRRTRRSRSRTSSRDCSRISSSDARTHDRHPGRTRDRQDGDRDLPAEAADGHRALSVRTTIVDSDSMFAEFFVRGEPRAARRTSASGSSFRSSHCASRSRRCSRRRPA